MDVEPVKAKDLNQDLEDRCSSPLRAGLAIQIVHPVAGGQHTKQAIEPLATMDEHLNMARTYSSLCSIVLNVNDTSIFKFVFKQHPQMMQIHTENVGRLP